MLTILTLVGKGAPVRQWVLMNYEVASEPSARRVAIWRKVKRLGALLVHDAIWVLPATPTTIEQFQWIASDIRELQGSALVWQAHLLLDGQDEELVQQFMAQVETEYQALLVDAGRITHTPVDRVERTTLAALARRYQQTYARDYFHSPLAVQVRQALARASETPTEKEVER
ncbi:MAG TPA: Chromate resistance protein ChrB [Ktedonobacterales bacterium]|nr:Chromate resistance protein ChrB [Ktedonobacterales bacterium]